MPTVEEIRRKLIAIAFLENTERASEARVSWRQLVLSAKGDSKNPIYQLAIKHLEGAP
jgi:hypothetical protein